MPVKPSFPAPLPPWAVLVLLPVTMGACADNTLTSLEDAFPDTEASDIRPHIMDTPSGDDGAFSPDTADTAGASVIDGDVDLETEAMHQPTWWDCRRALTQNAMTPDLSATCQSLHAAAPELRVYGIRWINLDTTLDMEAWIAPRLQVLNSLFSPSQIAFKTTSQLTIVDTAAPDPLADDTLSLLAWAGDTAQHLASPLAAPATLVSMLRDALDDTGVAPEAVDALTLQTTMDAQEYLGTMARIRPEEIHVIIAPMLNGHSLGGQSSGPKTNPTGRTVSVVYVRSADDVSTIVPTHEMGHFFGLKHPHTTVDAAVDEAPFDFAEAILPTPVTDQVIDTLRQHLGTDLDGDLGTPYPPWNASFESEIMPFEALRSAVGKLWLRPHHTYQHMDADPVPFSGLADFVAAGEAAAPIFYKNWSAKGQGNGSKSNCRWDDDLALFVCELGSPIQTIAGTHEMLDGSIFFDEGQRMNVMTYIGKTLPAESLPELSAFSARAIPVMHLHANTPMRLMLRNHALDDAPEARQ